MIKWNDMYTAWAQKQKGFTIVELLIVIVVIGILAAIVIVAFNGVQNRANDTAVRSDLAMIKKKLEAFRVTDANNYYPTELTTTNVGIKVSTGAYGNHFATANGDHNLLYCVNSVPARTAFAVIARSKSGATFAVTDTAPVREISTSMTTAGTSCIDQGMTATAAWWGLYQGSWRTALL